MSLALAMTDDTSPRLAEGSSSHYVTSKFRFVRAVLFHIPIFSTHSPPKLAPQSNLQETSLKLKLTLTLSLSHALFF
ncbi:hypothetical protein VNO80_06634 [Phaseolus coccineus]|uniref:Uncharacterized protein n=1 Tax=Phaseolus coccineus TaxID=3886 RepID=A0AAN9REN6_PHACN